MTADAKYIKDNALDFANVPLIDRRVIASVHLENRDDEQFWDTVLPHPQGKHYNYIYESRISKDSAPQRGVNQCLRYKPYLSDTFFICIDSDLRYLLREPEIDAEHFILQTYTYSWENHYCLAAQLQSRLQQLAPEAAYKFDFQSFLNSLSSIAYLPLLYLLEGLRLQLMSSSAIGLFHDCFPSQAKADIFDDNGKSLLNVIHTNLSTFQSNPAFRGVDIDVAKEHFAQLGLTEENTYLHLRGHNIFNLISHIGKMLCSHYQINFREQVLIPSLQQSGYWEMDKINKDIQQTIKL